MKASILALAATISLVAAQNFGDEPACAIPCLTSAISVAGCGLNDQGCQCGTGQAAIASAAAPCLIAGCAASDLLLAQSVGAGLCSVYSAGLASNSTTSTVASSQASTSAAAPASTTGISSAIETVNATSTASLSPATTSAATTKSVTTTASSRSESSSSASGSTSSATTQTSSGAASGLTVGFGGVIAVVAGVAAAL